MKDVAVQRQSSNEAGWIKCHDEAARVKISTKFARDTQKQDL